MVSIPESRRSLLAPVLYIKRQPSVSVFISWATSENAFRLRSLVGPPGAGKSTFLRQLADALARTRLPVLYLNLSEVEWQADSLAHWLSSSLKELERQGWIGFSSDEAVEGKILNLVRDRLSLRIIPWDVVLLAFPAQHVILLLDGYDELPLKGKEWVEERILVPFLFPAEGPANGRAVVARRDEYGLNEVVLRWEEEALELKGLDVAEQEPAEQIRRRLAAVTGQTPDEARRLLEWPDAPDEAIAFVTRLDDQSHLIEGLKPFLTPNPFVNLLLLRRALQRGNGQLNRSDLRHCLDAYLHRAGLAEQDTARLIAAVNAVEDPGRFRLAEYRKPTESQNPHPYPEIGRLMAAGIVAQVPKTSRYRFEPAVIKLVEGAAG